MNDNDLIDMDITQKGPRVIIMNFVKNNRQQSAHTTDTSTDLVNSDRDPPLLVPSDFSVSVQTFFQGVSKVIS